MSLIFYRCDTCHRPVNAWDIDKGGCQNCGGVRIRPTNLTLLEMVAQIVKHPKVWKWKEQTAGQDGETANVLRTRS